MESTKPNIFTMTASVDLFKNNPGFLINLPNLYHKNQLTTNVIGIKYNWMNKDYMKGTYSTTVFKKSKSKKKSTINVKSFYNQVSLVIKPKDNDKQINVKLFGNGKLQMTGCKKVSDAVNAAEVIRDYLNNMVHSTRSVDLVYDINGVLRDENDIVYSHTDNPVIIGWFDKDNSEYLIDRKRCVFDEKLGLFVTTKTFQSRSRLIYDLAGKHVGDMAIQLLRNKKKLYSKFTDIQIINDLVYVNNEIIIGKNIVSICDTAIRSHSHFISNTKMILLNESPYLDSFGANVIEPIQTDFVEENVDIYSIMANYNLGYQINRQKLFDFLNGQQYLTKYNPETYSGLYVMYKYSTLDLNTKQIGKCTCNNKCTCDSVSIIVFQSGNMIFSGAKNINQLHTVFRYFVNLLNENASILKKKELI